MIDLYCERSAIGLWNEPFNAVSNGAFIIAALLAWNKLASRGNSDVWEKLVITLAAMVGIGSFVFHTFATQWAAQVDIIPIWAFVGSYTLLIIYRLNRQNTGRTLLTALLVIAAMLALRAATSDSLGTHVNAEITTLNGSLQYLPPFATLIGFALLAHFYRHEIRNHLLIASALFLTALSFRTIDIALCYATSGIGTHFLWHILMAAVIGTLLQGLILKLPPRI